MILEKSLVGSDVFIVVTLEFEKAINIDLGKG